MDSHALANRRLATALTTTSLALAIGACGPEEPPEPPPQQRCQSDDLKAYLEGSIDDGQSPTSIRLASDDSTPGSIGIHEIRIRLGKATPPDGGQAQPVILRLYDARSQTYLSETIDTLTDGADPLQLTIYDASQLPAGSDDLTRLNHHGCTIDEGTICAQLGFDANGDGLLFDDDHFVYNAVGGTVTIEGFDPVARTFTAHWDLAMGRNILRFDDDSQGAAQGCFRPRYVFQGGDDWILQ